MTGRTVRVWLAAFVFVLSATLLAMPAVAQSSGSTLTVDDLDFIECQPPSAAQWSSRHHAANNNYCRLREAHPI